uniref:Uncharacterized protein n=1 Tax=Anguilla anguilla TaxID=7936 RepID=A0A0E9VX19_ANGAN
MIMVATLMVKFAFIGSL